MQTVITKPTFADVNTIKELVVFLALEIKDSRAKQDELFKQALQCTDDPFAYYETKALVDKMDTLTEQEQDLAKYMRRVHLLALESFDEVFPLPIAA